MPENTGLQPESRDPGENRTSDAPSLKASIRQDLESLRKDLDHCQASGAPQPLLADTEVPQAIQLQEEPATDQPAAPSTLNAQTPSDQDMSTIRGEIGTSIGCSFLSFIFCCFPCSFCSFPCSLIALFFASRANTRLDQKQLAEAKRNLARAWFWNVLALILGFIILLRSLF